jgi:AcrR family transcriptional regulator
MIERDGYRNFTTNKLARQAKIGVASIYEYFENKDQIFIAVLEYELSDTMAKLEAHIPEVLAYAPADAIRSVFTLILNEVVKKSEIMRAIAGHLHGASSFPPTVKFFGQSEMIIRLLLVTFNGRRDAKIDLDAYIVTHAIAGICIGVANGLPHGQTIEDIVERLVDHLVALVAMRTPHLGSVP